MRDSENGKGEGKIMYGVTIAELIEKMKLKNMTPEIDVEKAVLTLQRRRLHQNLHR